MNDKKLEVALNDIISNSLWAPRGDPDSEQLESAALAYKELKRNGLKVDGEDGVISVLSGNNVYETNFLED